MSEGKPLYRYHIRTSEGGPHEVRAHEHKSEDEADFGNLMSLTLYLNGEETGDFRHVSSWDRDEITAPAESPDFEELTE